MKVPKVKPVVGIVSYLPDDEKIRTGRWNKLLNLISQINKIFKIPVIIIAQNWKEDKLPENISSNRIYLYKYDQPLGIIGARKELKRKFMSSNFDYLIMLDDDSELKGTRDYGKAYLDKLDTIRDGWGEYTPQLLKLFAISKSMFEKIDYPDGGADDPDPMKRFFEDALLIKALDKHYPEKSLKFPRYKELSEVSDSAWDGLNTGWHDRVYSDAWNRHDTGDLTRYLVWNSTLDNRGHIIFHFPESRDLVERGTTWTGEKRVIYDNDYKVSIIIPTYNNANYIINCLNSIPDRDNIEVIVIDDGSTDNTLELLKIYDRLTHFSYYHQENKGPGMARNVGLDHAKGKYIYFLDSDDTVHTDNFNGMMDRGFAQLDKYDPDIITPLRQDKTIEKDGTYHTYYPGIFQGRFVKRSLIGDIRHNDKIVGEDMDFMHEVEAIPHSNINIGIVTYLYNFPRDGSLTDLYNHDMFEYYSAKMGKAIGIISYFPDGELGDIRRKGCFNLLRQLNEYVKYPIYIVAQCWTTEDLLALNEFENQHITIIRYSEPIGIANARIRLRQELLGTNYEWFIFLDDDMKLGSEEGINTYINSITPNYAVYYIDNFLINGTCVSRDVLTKIPFDNLDPAKGEGFEDWLWFEKCVKMFRAKNVGPSLIEGTRHDYLTKYQECYSTWNNKDSELERINTEKTRELIFNIGK